MMHLRCLGLLASVLFACDATAPSAPAPPPPAHEPEPALAAEAAPEAEPAAAAPQPAPEPLVAPPGALEFFVVAQKRSTYPTFEAFATRAGDVFITFGPRVMSVGDDGQLRDDPKWLRGLHTYDPVHADSAIGWDVETLGGSAPNALFMTLWSPTASAEGYPYEAYRWSGEGWRRLDTGKELYVTHPAKLATWSGGSVLAGRRIGTPLGGGSTDAKTERARDAALKKVKPLVVVAGPGKAPTLDRWTDFDALPSGELFVLVGSTVKRFDGTAALVADDALPSSKSLYDLRITLEMSDRAYVYGALEDGSDDGSPYLARWDGRAWTRQPAPPCKAALIDFAWSAVSGAWAICKTGESIAQTGPFGALYVRLSETGAWTPVGSVGDQATNVVVGSGGDLWVTTATHAYASHKPARVLELSGGFSDLAELIAEHNPSPVAFTCPPDGARTGYAILRGTDHAALAEALDGLGLKKEVDVDIVQVMFRGRPRPAVRFADSALHEADREKLAAAVGSASEGTYCLGREPLE